MFYSIKGEQEKEEEKQNNMWGVGGYSICFESSIDSHIVIDYCLHTQSISFTILETDPL